MCCGVDDVFAKRRHSLAIRRESACEIATKAPIVWEKWEFKENSFRYLECFEYTECLCKTFSFITSKLPSTFSHKGHH